MGRKLLKVFIAILLLQLSHNSTWGVKKSFITLHKSDSDRQSLDFILPDPADELGAQCLQHSAYFCLMGYRIYKKEREREPREDDKHQFEILVRDRAHRLNWFSFKEEDKNTDYCCTHQVNMYVEHGQRNGLSPEEYLSKVFDFHLTTQKDVVFIKVRWVPEACTHVISQIGFGLGKLKIVGGRGLTKKFVLPPLGNSQKIQILTGYQIKTKLAFPWFVVWVICGEKPWLCPNTDGFASSSGGRNL
ncbi:uncharacterized protein LOC142338195 [Convolutriloba macropyga]|uniref:uncharacterized protein LOC142338195 n=1 Tax=Convolutriloba macropyga TaxID=536237 RepID=UPI003F5215F6